MSADTGTTRALAGKARATADFSENHGGEVTRRHRAILRRLATVAEALAAERDELLRLAERCVTPFGDGEDSDYTQAEALFDLESYLRSRHSRHQDSGLEPGGPQAVGAVSSSGAILQVSDLLAAPAVTENET